VTWLDSIADKALDRVLPARSEALAVLASGDDELLDVVVAAFRVRRHYFGRRVKLNYLVNIKSGLCPEDCFYCSQRPRPDRPGHRPGVPDDLAAAGA
jgi:biotin synthase